MARDDNTNKKLNIPKRRWFPSNEQHNVNANLAFYNNKDARYELISMFILENSDVFSGVLYVQYSASSLVIYLFFLNNLLQCIDIVMDIKGMVENT